MCIWKWCVEGWVIVCLVGGFFVMTMVRGCSADNIVKDRLEHEKIIQMAKAGLQQKVVSGSRINQRTIWVKDLNVSAVEYKVTD